MRVKIEGGLRGKLRILWGKMWGTMRGTIGRNVIEKNENVCSREKKRITTHRNNYVYIHINPNLRLWCKLLAPRCRETK